jgi:hypothetical protein
VGCGLGAALTDCDAVGDDLRVCWMFPAYNISALNMPNPFESLDISSDIAICENGQKNLRSRSYYRGPFRLKQEKGRVRLPSDVRGVDEGLKSGQSHIQPIGS